MAGISGLSGATRRALMGTALTGTLLLAACGSSGTKAAATQPSTAAKAAGSSGASSAPASSAPSTSAAKAPTGDSGSSFCQKARDETAAQAKNAEALASNDPTSLKKLEEDAHAALAEFASSAPSQIKSAVQSIADADNTLFDQLKAANFDVSKLSTSALGAFNSPALQQAETKVTDYLASVCGIKSDTGIPSSAG